MKRIYFILVLILIGTSMVQAQEEDRRTPQVRRGSRDQTNENASGLPELTVRAQIMNEQLTRDIENARWMRIIYRQLNMLDEKNAPLYYPETPINGTMNLFTTIFQLAAEGKIPIYRYMVDGYEAFDEDHLLNFREDVLDRFEIYYDEISTRNAENRYVISESDIPSSEVKAFYIKEAWFFDQNNSLFDVKILAICPIITRLMDFGDQTTPMFWLTYESLRPYISNNYIMTSNLNNARTFTMDDYFRRRMFDGEIYKTENLLNLPLQAYCPTPDSLKSEQEKIERQLVDFNESLWFRPDTTQVLAATNKKEAKKSARASRVKQEKVAKDKSSSGSSKAPKAPKAERSSPARSVRRGG